MILDSPFQVACHRSGPGAGIFGQRQLPWPILLHREAVEVLSNWCNPGGECMGAQVRFLTWRSQRWYLVSDWFCVCMSLLT